jgi:hypothetical protein
LKSAPARTAEGKCPKWDNRPGHVVPRNEVKGRSAPTVLIIAVLSASKIVRRVSL